MELPAILPLPQGLRDSWRDVLPEVAFQNELAALREAPQVDAYVAALIALAPHDRHLSSTAGPPFVHERGLDRLEYRSLNADLVLFVLVHAVATMATAPANASALLSAAHRAFAALPPDVLERALQALGLATAASADAGLALLEGLAEMINLAADVQGAARYKDDDGVAPDLASVYTTLAAAYGARARLFAQHALGRGLGQRCTAQEQRLMALAAATLARHSLRVARTTAAATEVQRAYLLLTYAMRLDAATYADECRRLEVDAYRTHGINLLDTAQTYGLETMTTEALAHQSSLLSEAPVLLDPDAHPLLGAIRAQRRRDFEPAQTRMHQCAVAATQHFQLTRTLPPQPAAAETVGWSLVSALVAFAELARLNRPDLLATARLRLLASKAVTAAQLDALASPTATRSLPPILADLAIMDTAAPPTPLAVLTHAFQRINPFAAAATPKAMTYEEWLATPPVSAEAWRASGRMPVGEAWRHWIPRAHQHAVLASYSDAEWADVLGLPAEVLKDMHPDLKLVGPRWNVDRAVRRFGLTRPTAQVFASRVLAAEPPKR